MAEELAFLRELERADETLRVAGAELDELAAEVERVRLCAAELEARARELGAAFRKHPRLADKLLSSRPWGLGGVVEWGTAARAALFVARGGLDSEREAVIR